MMVFLSLPENHPILNGLVQRVPITNNATLTVQPFVFNLSSTNVFFSTNGMQLQLAGVFATNAMILYASTDLVSWLPILTNPPATGSVLFLDSDATNWPQRFYRATEQ